MKQLIHRLGEHAESVEVINPATGTVAYTLPQFSYDAVRGVAAEARAAASDWAAVGVRERSSVLLKLHDLMIEHEANLLDLIQFETGKSRASAFEDYAGALFAARHYGKRAPKILGLKTMRTDAPLFVRNYVDYPPVGVVGVITPWNFPLALPAFDVLPALAAGNTVVHKVDNQVALSGLYLRQLAEDAGLPRGVWNVVVGSGADAGNAVTDSVDYVAFTGSTATGRLVAERAAKRLIGCSLELGGKNPAIVLPDANLARAAEIVVAGAVGNAGQICVSLERCFVPEHQVEEFVSALETQIGALRYGQTHQFDTEMGSLTSAAQLKRVLRMLGEARDAGLRVIGGNARTDVGPFFIEPAIVVEPTDAVSLNRGEVFGPVIQVYGYQSIDEAVDRANDTEFGLNASVIGPMPLALEVSRRLQAGSVNINEGYRASFGSMASPMGGVKQSGQGRRNGDGGLLRFTEPKAIGVASNFLKLPTRAEHWRVISRVLIVLSKALRRI